MTSTAQRAELQNKIWKIANEVRGSVDGWDFKQFVLGTLFYRFISENFTNYIEGGDDSIGYAKLSDDVITPEIKEDAIKTKGYFIYPSQLFVNVVKIANTNPNLNTDLKAIFDAIESSANGFPSEPDIKGLFVDFDTTSTRLGNTVESKNTRLAAVLKGVEDLNFGNFEDNQIDLFGDAYEFLISNYAANAGKSGGEFFTPQHVSKLIAQLAMHKQTSVNKIYDPACGSGSLLLQAKKHFDNHIIEEGFYGQEVNHTTYNLARMNMFLHNINYDKFNIALGDTLRDPHFGDENPLMPSFLIHLTLSIGEIRRGTAITEKETNQGEYPVVANSPSHNYYHDQSNRRGETVVIARSGAYAGLVSYWDIPIFLTDAFSIHPDNNILSTKFLYYALKKDQTKIHNMAKGAGVPDVRANDFGTYVIPVPSLEEQARIVSILDKFDTLTTSISVGLPKEIELRKKQYEYYRDLLLTFPKSVGADLRVCPV